jgi:hypothetical protein
MRPPARKVLDFQWRVSIVTHMEANTYPDTIPHTRFVPGITTSNLVLTGTTSTTGANVAPVEVPRGTSISLSNGFYTRNGRRVTVAVFPGHGEHTISINLVGFRGAR